MILKCFKQMSMRRLLRTAMGGSSSRRPRPDDGDDREHTPSSTTPDAGTSQAAPDASTSQPVPDAGASQAPPDAGTSTRGVRMFMFQFFHYTCSISNFCLFLAGTDAGVRFTIPPGPLDSVLISDEPPQPRGSRRRATAGGIHDPPLQFEFL